MPDQEKPPADGGGVRVLTAIEAVEYHEFFPKGVAREVLLLGEAEEQVVHHVSGSKRKLCTARVGVCQLCEEAPYSTKVEQAQVEEVAPAMVRGLRDTAFEQRVAVFPRAAAEQLRKLCGDEYRGKLFSVLRGSSNRLTIKPLGSMPKGFPAAIPPFFSTAPFVRARFGLKYLPTLPFVFIDPIRVEAPRPVPAGRARPLQLYAEDAPAEAQEIKRMIAEWRSREEQGGAAERAGPVTAAQAAPPAAVVEPAELVAADRPDVEVLDVLPIPDGYTAGPRVRLNGSNGMIPDATTAAEVAELRRLQNNTQPSPAVLASTRGTPPPAGGVFDQVLNRAARIKATPALNGHANGHAGKGGAK